MTDQRTSTFQESIITVATGVALASILRALLPVEYGTREMLLLPSSLQRRDVLANAVRDVLRTQEVTSRLVLPANPLAELTHMRSRAAGSRWTSIEIHPPDVPARTIMLPSRLLGDVPYWSITDVDAVIGRGPYVLDLLARHVHPVTRIRNLATRARASAAVEVNIASVPTLCVIGKEFASFAMVGLTSDPIAGELFALALADEDLSADRSVAGPWEEPVVQRATELGLGVRIPQELSVQVVGSLNPLATPALQRITSRMGVTLS